jgi:phosphatidylglycerol:prolipoprotein diacylglycerol transferase
VCGWYGLGRAWIEGLRTDSLYLPPIFGIEFRISQVLAIGIFALCLGILIYHAVKKTDKPLYVKANKKG